MNHVDTTQAAHHISLCAGYGGIDLGLRRVVPNLRTVAFCEIEAFACANLVSKMEAGLLDPAPVWTDLKTFPWAEFRDRVDILSGGYPCQPFSAAGKRLGKDDPRHLWPFIADGIRWLRPRVCFFENVEGHISLGLREVIEELEGIGYATTWGIFSAAEAGAPHQRKRVFILAHLHGAGPQGHVPGIHDKEGWQEPGGPAGGCGGPVRSGAVANPHGLRGGKDREPAQFRTDRTEQPSRNCGHSNQASNEQVWPSRPGQPQHGWEPPRVVADAGSIARRQTGRQLQSDKLEECGRDTSSAELGAGSTNEELGNAKGRDGFGSAQRKAGHAAQPDESDVERKTQPALGGNPDGPAGGMDYAELCVSCDNRTDELRLLGNGVVPMTAEIAFRTLSSQLIA